jgi:hypothetical protein
MLFDGSGKQEQNLGQTPLISLKIPPDEHAQTSKEERCTGGAPAFHKKISIKRDHHSCC